MMVLILFVVENKFIARQFSLVKEDFKCDVGEEHLLIIYLGKDLNFKWQLRFKKEM